MINNTLNFTLNPNTFKNIFKINEVSFFILILVIILLIILIYLIRKRYKTKEDREALIIKYISRYTDPGDVVCNFDNKIKKFHFSSKELSILEKTIEKIKKQEEKREKKEKDKEEEEKIVNRIIEINFNLIEEFEVLIPSIEGTYKEFEKALNTFIDIISIFVSDEEEKEIIELKDNLEYNKLISLLESKAYSYQENVSVKNLIESSLVNYLHYGKYLEIEIKDPFYKKFIVNSRNLKLYREIYYLFQELFLNYVISYKRKDYKSFDHLLEELSLEELNNIRFEKTLEQLGRDVINVLVQDFLTSLKPVKRDKINEFKIIRLILREENIKEPIEIGNFIYNILNIIKETYKNIQNNIAVKSYEEIDKLLKVSKLSAPQKIEERELTDIELEEKELRETIFDITKFLCWFPQDISLLREEEKILINYFDNLLFSKKKRINILKKEEEKSLYKENLEKVMKKIDKAYDKVKELKEKIKKQDIFIKIIPPRQAEDYFPLEGKIEEIIEEDIKQNRKLIKMLIKEKNNLKSYIIYTGNNITFENN